MKKRWLFAALYIGILAAVFWFLFAPRAANNLCSPNDADGDGIDDWTDMARGALAYTDTEPRYVSEYYEGGYPPEGEGVCTDVIWQAFAAAGYDLKAMVDEDIAQAPEEYPIDTPDPNIDFRRVRNLKVFFERHADSLTIERKNPDDWQPGDIVVFRDHIGICSERRNRRGIPLLIHHANLFMRAGEQDILWIRRPYGHYRWTGEH